MRTEHLPQGSAETIPPLTLEETNLIQLELMPADGPGQMAWIENHSENFRKIVEEYPQIPVWYRDNRERCLDFIRKHLEELTATRH